MPIDLRPYQDEIRAGLPTARTDMDRAAKYQSYLDYDSTRYEAEYRRDAESGFDYQGRSHRQSGFLTECLDILCEHVYSPGPSRRWSEEAGDELLRRVYADNLVNSILLEADILSSLNQFVGIQIDPGKGDFAIKPITYRLWGREELTVWADPDDRCQPMVVVTRDKYNEQKRCRLWTDEVVQTFLSKPLAMGQTSGGIVLQETGPPGPHGYGCLPFTFVCYQLPVRGFPVWGLSVRPIGELLVKAERTINGRLMGIDESIAKYLNPIPIAEGMPETWKPDVEPGRFIRVPRADPTTGASGGYEKGEFARLSYLQAIPDVAGAWLDLEKYLNQMLEAARVPLSAARMEQSGVASGISLMVEQEPLLKRAEKRRAKCKVEETDLAKRTLMVAGNHYNKPEYLASLAAKDAKLTAAWPRPRLAISTMDSLELGVARVQAGLSSHLQLIQDDYGVERDEALEIARQIAQDQAELARVNPEVADATMIVNPNEEQGQED